MRRARPFATLLVVSLLSACAGTTPPPVAPPISVLEPPAPTEPLRHRSNADLQVQLGRLADLLAEASIICRHLGQIALDVVPERPLMGAVEPVSFLTAKDIADRIRVDEKTIRRGHQAGRIPKGITIGGVLRWPAETINVWIEDRLR